MKIFTELHGSLRLSYMIVLNMHFIFVSIILDGSLSAIFGLSLQVYNFMCLVHTPGSLEKKKQGGQSSNFF